MDVNFDFNALLNTAIISGLEKDPKNKTSAEILKIFAKRGIGVMDAMAILYEIAAVTQSKNGEKNI